MRSNERVTYLAKPVTLTDLLAPGEHRIFVATGTGLSIHIASNLHGIQTYVTGPMGIDNRFGGTDSTPENQAEAWAHATTLLADAFATTETVETEAVETVVEEPTQADTPTAAIVEELAPAVDELVTITAAASITAHRQRKTAVQLAGIPTDRGWAARGCRVKMNTARYELMNNADTSGRIHRGPDATITQLKTLIKMRWAEPIEGTWRGRPSLIGAMLNDAGRLALAEEQARRDRAATRAARLAAVLAPAA